MTDALPLPLPSFPPFRCSSSSIWLFQVKTANSDYPLHALFYRLASLFRLPIRPLFVFDGNARPDVKRGKTVPKTTKGGGMANERAFREMIDAFGFDSWTVSRSWFCWVWRGGSVCVEGTGRGGEEGEVELTFAFFSRSVASGSWRSRGRARLSQFGRFPRCCSDGGRRCVDLWRDRGVRQVSLREGEGGGESSRLVADRCSFPTSSAPNPRRDTSSTFRSTISLTLRKSIKLAITRSSSLLSCREETTIRFVLFSLALPSFSSSCTPI